MNVAQTFEANSTIDSWALLYELEEQLDLVRNDITCLESSHEQPAMLVATANASDIIDRFVRPLVETMGPPVLGARPRDIRPHAFLRFDAPDRTDMIVDLIDKHGEADSRSAKQTPSRRTDGSVKGIRETGVSDSLRRLRDYKPVSSTRSNGARWMFDQTVGLFGLTMDKFDRWQLVGTGASTTGRVPEPSCITRRPSAWPFVAFDIDADLFPDPVYGLTDGTTEQSMFVTPEAILRLEPNSARADLSGVLADPITVIQNRP